MAMATLNASLLARKGTAYPAASTPRHLASVSSAPVKNTAATPKTGNRHKGANAEKKTRKKFLRVSTTTDRDIRLLAVRQGLSQQALMERAINDYLDSAFATSDCLCRRR